MIFKIVLLFLVFIACLAMLGKMHWIGGKRVKSRQCQSCGRYKIRRGPCSCQRG